MERNASHDSAIVYRDERICSADSTSLFLRHWAPAEGPVRAGLLILHGYMEHGGRYAELARHMGSIGIATAAVDLRGHGRSDGARGYVERYSDYIDDAQAALSCLEPKPLFMLGHSNGAVVALEMAAYRQPDLAGLAVTSPFLALTRVAPLPKLWIGRMAGHMLPGLNLPSGVRSEDLTHDPGLTEAHRRDPLVFGHANAAWFREVRLAQTRVCALQNLSTPLLYVYGDADPVASPQANAALADALKAPEKTVVVRHNALHEVLNETDRATLHHTLGRWILEHARRVKA